MVARRFGLIRTSGDVEPLAASVPTTEASISLPFEGLGAHIGDQYARGFDIRLTRGTNAGHICASRALRGIAYQVADLFDANGATLELRCSSCASMVAQSANNALMQFQSGHFGRARSAAGGHRDQLRSEPRI